MKPQRPSTLKSNTLSANATHIHLQHKWNTHRHPYNIELMQEKLLFVLKMAKCLYLYNGVLSSLWLFSYNHTNSK
jgi:hypothetical protein